MNLTELVVLGKEIQNGTSYHGVYNRHTYIPLKLSAVPKPLKRDVEEVRTDAIQ